MRPDSEPPPGHLIGLRYTPPAWSRAPYAVLPENSLGRFYGGPESATRTCYQRDRDRIIHATAFRRLKHKTQVFVQHEGDYYRTRLTHSLEVAQIARSLARVLALDEDLAEGVALAHDLGHTPFGHAGEEALSAATASIGGFDHNAHALRLVTKLEHRYADFDGLNLTWETLEGMVKHNGPLKPPLPGPIASFDRRWPLRLDSWPGLEAQVAALADDIAYVNHDIDDGLRAELFSVADLAAAPLAGPHAQRGRSRAMANLELGRFIGELVRTLMSALVDDLLAETRRRIALAGPATADEVRGHRRCAGGLFARDGRRNPGAQSLPVPADVSPSPRHGHDGHAPRPWSRNSMRPSAAIRRCCRRIGRAIAGAAGDAATGGVVRDYIAGMTDRFALLGICADIPQGN